MLSAKRPGWVLDSVDLRSQAGTDYTMLARAGLGVIVCLNHSRGRGGTIPLSNAYPQFAARCAAYAKNSPGAHIWLIGNAMNTRPAHPVLPSGLRDPITAPLYAECFRQCRNAIKNVPGHADDAVIPGAVMPLDIESGDWVQYLVDILNHLTDAGGKPTVDGLALHCDTHEYNLVQITSDNWVEEPFDNRRQNFRTYRDYLAEIPTAFHDLPVFITQAAPLSGWRNHNIGWIQRAYQEINDWNSVPENQPIQALILYRWRALSESDQMALQNKPELMDDFRAALAAGYRAVWRERKNGKPINPAPLIEVQSSPANAPASLPAEHNETIPSLMFKSVSATPAQPAPVGRVQPYTVFAPVSKLNLAIAQTRRQSGIVVPSFSAASTERARRGNAPQNPPPAQTRLPKVTQEKKMIAEAPSSEYRAQFLAHDTPVNLVVGQTVTVNLRIRNLGGRAWAQSGNNAVHLGYKWLDDEGKPQDSAQDRRTALPADIAAKGETAFGAVLVAPRTPGVYQLQWDLVAEGAKWFGDGGSAPLVVPVRVVLAPEDVTGWRVEANRNSHQTGFALDGRPATFWDSGAAQAAGQWFRLNLDAPRVIDGIQFLSPGKGFPAAYALRISPDGRTWTEIVRVPSENASDVLAVFAPTLVQYAQLDLLEPAEAAWMISEILVHHANEWKVSTSHNDATAHCAVDDRVETAWSSGENQSVEMWFQIDLGRVEKVSGLVLIAPRDEFPRGLRVTVWNASANRWQIVADRADNRENPEILFPAIATEFINIQLVQSAEAVWSIQHARVYREMEGWSSPARVTQQ